MIQGGIWMNYKKRRRVAIILLIATLFINLFPISNGEGEVIITPMVETALAATETPTPTPVSTSTDERYFMVVNSNRHPNGSQIKMDTKALSLSITSSDYTTPKDATITWVGHDKYTDIIDVEFNTNNLFEATVTAVGPGYAQLGAYITYDKINYHVNCQIYVPIELADNNLAYPEGSQDKPYGMQTGMHELHKEKKVLQLAGPEALDNNRYLVKLKYVNYKTGITNKPTDDDVFDTKVPTLKWYSTDTNVVDVDQNGIVTSKGAGYAEIVIQPLTSPVAGNADEFRLPVFVGPTAYIVDDEVAPVHTDDITYESKSSKVIIQTNGLQTDKLQWIIKKNNSNGEVIYNNIEKKLKNDNMDVYLSEVSGTVTLSNLKAGVYEITARPHSPKEEYGEKNTRVKSLKIKLVVPIILPEGPIYMNVGDFYNILKESNIPNMDSFNFRPDNETIATVNNTGVITGVANGNTKIYMDYRGGLFPSENKDEQYTKELEVHVIDGISLNTTAATIYTGSTLQLILNASNNYSPITWTSSNPKVATVSKDGLVTGVSIGSTEIIVTQTINGVIKTAKCKILVKQSVTNITLDPSSTSLKVGDYLTINAEVTPKLNNVSLKWVTSDAKIVNITQTGDLSATVHGVAGGTAVITAINQDNIVVGSCLINVYEGITKITLSETLVTAPLSAKWFQLYATITPETAKDQEVIWTSTDPSVLTVDQVGKVTLKKAGKAAVVVTSKVDASITAICNVVVTKSVNNLKLDAISRNMYVGETYRLTYSISPADASNTALTWTSTNPSVASVNKEGLVSAKAVGQTVIIVKTVDGGYMATCTINVSRTATAVKLDVTKLTLNVGDYYTFVTTLTPKDSNETSLTWESSDRSIAVVSNNGRVTAKKAGTCIIMVKTKSGSTAYCTVTVLQGATGIKISKSTATVPKGQKLELTATVLPDGATDKGVTWKSSNPSIATVDKDGVVKGITGGVTIITATSNDGGYVDHCVLTVNELITEITLNKTYYKLGLGKTFRLVATVKGETATNQELRWSTSNRRIVTVDQNGRIKGIKLGTATVTVRATDGSGAEATCTVRVSRLVTSIDLNVNYVTIVQGKSYQLKANVLPKNATFKKPLWSSSNTEVAIVNKNGLITALTPGNTIVTAKANDSSGVSSICYVRVIAPVASTGITVSESEVVMSPGETKTVAISIVPNNSTDTYTWSSDNELVAKVDANSGIISARAIGTANITVMTESGRRGTIKVFVVGLSKTDLTLQQYTSLLLNLEVDGAGARDVKVRWDVDNQEIATVINGKVTGKALGTTYVYAVVNGRRLACKVTVVKIP